MLTTLIAAFIILFFTLVVVIGTWALIRLKKIGLLKGFMQGKWLLSLLTSILMISFFVSSIGLLIGTSWARSLLVNTIYVWLIYVWLYNLKVIAGMWTMLQVENPKSISHFMGRSPFFDELVHKSIDLSNTPSKTAESGESAHPVTDSPLEAMLNDENTFPELFQIGMRRKIRKKLIGLVVQTIIFIVILIIIR